MTPAAPLAVTMGEPAGIGGELTLRAWSQREANNLPLFVAYDNAVLLRAVARRRGLDVPIEAIQDPAQAREVFSRALPVIEIDLAAEVVPGTPETANVPSVTKSIRNAVQAVQRQQCAAIVTNPIHKSIMTKAGFRHPGHTEYLAELGKVATSVMMLANDQLRVVPLTIHIPLHKVASSISTAKIVAYAEIVARELTNKFGIADPRIAIAGLNPHAGEDGTIGKEEIEIIMPAIEQLRAKGLNIIGPLSADTMFHEEARKNYDCALCMYHDQALIPLKTLGFWDGVNVTLGLPFIRTSPDHGTALDIARDDGASANPASLISALRMAQQMAQRAHSLPRPDAA